MISIRQKEILLPGSEVIKLFSCSTQLSMKFIMLINVKMPTIVGILTLISMINTSSKSLKAREIYMFQYFSFYEQSEFQYCYLVARLVPVLPENVPASWDCPEDLGDILYHLSMVALPEILIYCPEGHGDILYRLSMVAQPEILNILY